MRTDAPKRIVFINSHPIQYHVPLYQKIAREAVGTLQQTVWYLSDQTLNGYTDKQFGSFINWGIPLLDGYKYIFIPNDSWKPSHNNGFFGLINWGLIQALRQLPKSIVVVYGWAYASNVITLLAARWYGHTVCMRGDNSFEHERHKGTLKKLLRWCYLQFVVVANTDYYLYVGRQNKKLFESFGVPDHKLVFVPHAVDNERFGNEYAKLYRQREALKDSLGLADKRVLLFVGKLYAVKRVHLILQAYHQLASRFSDVAMVFVGDGEQRDELLTYCQKHRLENVLITGFVNQQQLPMYYTIGDIFVMCSGVETWGLAVNEAMNFSLPLVLSDSMGCTDDLLVEGLNGHKVVSGDLTSLVDVLTTMLTYPADQLTAMGRASSDRLAEYSYDSMIKAIEQHVAV